MSEEELAALPLEQLEASIASLAGAGTIPEGAVPVAGTEPMPPAPPMIPPGMIEAATAKMVEMGLLAQATTELSPQVLEAIQSAADQLFPGMFDVNNPDELMEALNVIVRDETSPGVRAGADAGAGAGADAGSGRGRAGGRLLLGGNAGGRIDLV
tara:strand:- start:4763 stop:5227 length:465 start_codon:yes stop_codon:yes gene_type:complete